MMTRSDRMLLASLPIFLGMLCIPLVAQNETNAEAEGEASSAIMEGLRFAPGLSLGASAHSNPYYRGKKQERDGLVYYVDPALGISLGVNEFVQFELYGRLNYSYVDLSGKSSPEEDKNGDVLQPYVTAKARVNTSEFTSFSLRDAYQQASLGGDISAPEYKLNETQLDGRHVFGESFSAGLWGRYRTYNEDSSASIVDFDETAAGIESRYIVSRTDSGADVIAGLDFSGGRREYDKGSFVGQSSRENPKTHDYTEVHTSLRYPFSPGLQGGLSVGWRWTDYAAAKDAASKRNNKTDDASFSGDLTLTPGGRVSYTLAGSYSVQDTLLLNEEDSQRAVFDSLDPLLNNLNTYYRQQEVSRIGIASKVPVTDTVALGFSAVYQHATADKSEDIASISGQSGSTPVELKEDRWTLGAKADYKMSRYVNLTLAVEHGKADNDGEDIYEYDAVALQAKVDI